MKKEKKLILNIKMHILGFKNHEEVLKFLKKQVLHVLVLDGKSHLVEQV